MKYVKHGKEKQTHDNVVCIYYVKPLYSNQLKIESFTSILVDFYFSIFLGGHKPSRSPFGSHFTSSQIV